MVSGILTTALNQCEKSLLAAVSVSLTAFECVLRKFYPNHKTNGKRLACASYSVRRDLTGFCSAAFTACTLTVSRVSSSAPPPAPANTHHESGVR